MVGEISLASSSSSSRRKIISLSGWPERGAVSPLPGPARGGVAVAFGVVGAVGLGVLRRSAPPAPPGLRARRHSRAGTGGLEARNAGAVGVRDSETPRLTMKRRAPGCMEVAPRQDGESRPARLLILLRPTRQ